MEDVTPTADMNKSIKSSSFIVTRWLFFRGLGLIHLAAFGSYALQIIGLNGAEGIESTQSMLRAAGDHFGSQAYYLMPTVEWLNSSDTALLAIAWGGTFLSVLVTLGICTAPVLLILCILWLSLVTGGGEFTAFQSDGMLVEATVLSLFFAPWQWFEPPWNVPARLLEQSAPSPISIFMLRLMLFRLMLAAGVVKIESGDKTWRNLTALNYHFETQPIPTPLAWYAHWMPEWTHKVSVIAMFLSESIAPFLIFAGRHLRIVAAILIAGLHFMIAVTGNYTFLNMLCIWLCVSLLEDRLVSHIVPSWIVTRIKSAQKEFVRPLWTKVVAKAVAAVLIFLASCQFLSTAAGSVLPEMVDEILSAVAPFHLADRYGLFAVMTKTRPEIVFEGSRDGQNWRAYEFKYKPGDDLKRAPPWVEPHMPRLDWRLWFAAMQPVEANPWVLSLVRHLLEGDSSMHGFFAVDPFEKVPPLFIRAFVYDYHFTTPEEKKADGAWWRRDNKQIYLPPTALVDGKLMIIKSKTD